jgi:diaminopimelate decarboxylase
MERISFGPPPVNAAKLLALIECGKVDLTCLATGPSDEADVIVDAVIPPPGASAGQDGPAASLVRDRVVRTAHGRRGLELTSDLFCVGVHGRPQRGLTVIGRATEDWVIGNDTLNRSLHPHPDLWAQRVLERAVHP